MERVATLDLTIAGHYQRLEQVPGKEKLADPYTVLDTVIDMEQT